MFDRNRMETLAGKEIQYILTSTTSGHAVSTQSPDHERVLGMLFDSLRRAIAKGKINGGNVNEIIRNTPHYKLAEMLKTASTWEEFREMVEQFLPSYDQNPRALLKLGGFEWKPASEKFVIPPVRGRRYRKDAPMPPKEEIADSVLSTIEKGFQDLSNRMISLEEDNINLKKTVALLMKKLMGADVQQTHEVLSWLVKATG